MLLPVLSVALAAFWDGSLFCGSEKAALCVDGSDDGEGIGWEVTRYDGCDEVDCSVVLGPTRALEWAVDDSGAL